MIGLSPPSAMAQTPTATAQTPTAIAANAANDLLQPSLQGNPATPPRFRRPGQPAPSAIEPPPPNKFAAPTRIGATPIPNLYINCGWGTGGFKAIPVGGWTLAHVLATGANHPLAEPFQLERFISGRLIDEAAASGIAH